MSDRPTIGGDHVAIPHSTLALQSGEDGNFVLFDLDQMFDGPQFILSREALEDWASRNVDANLQEGGRPFDSEDMEAGYNARLVSGSGIGCQYCRDKEGNFWCVWRSDATSDRYDFRRDEATAIVAFMGTTEFTEYMAHAPASSSA